MSTHQYVWRIVVDTWPTENGQPFAWQGYEYWEAIVDAHRAGEPVPSWLPEDFSEWLVPEASDEVFASILPERPGFAIGWTDAPDYSNGYGGDSQHLMNVPHTSKRRYFSKSALTGRLADLLAWGCEARIERASIGEWEDA